MRFTIGSVRQWHWISAAVCMGGMLMFAITGITLNHAATISASPTIRTVEASVPVYIAEVLSSLPEGSNSLPDPIRKWLAETHDIYPPRDIQGEWDGIELYAAWPGPGKDSWMAIDPVTPHLLFESTDRGWIAYLNDLHKGRDTGLAWSWFIDIFAGICIIFTVTGLQLLIKQAPHKASTWPVTALGLLAPMIIMLVFIH